MQALILFDRNTFSLVTNKKVILRKFDKLFLIFGVHWNNVECLSELNQCMMTNIFWKEPSTGTKAIHEFASPIVS